MTDEKTNLQRRIDRCQRKNDELIELGDQLSAELGIAQQSIINSPTGRQDFESVLEEAERDCGIDFADRARSAWERDQRKGRTGSRSNRWSPTTIRIALAVYSRSPRAYEAWKEFKCFALPDKRTIQRFVAKNFKCNPGINMDAFSKDAAHYWDIQKSRENFPGLGEGCLVVDEVKIIAKLVFNLNSGAVVGTCTTSEEFSSIR